MFLNNATKSYRDKNHAYDDTGKSKNYSVSFNFKSGDYSAVECYDWSNELTLKKGWEDELRVTIFNQEFFDFLYNEQYK